jgi:hypothetical protein
MTGFYQEDATGFDMAWAITFDVSEGKDID